MLEFSKWLSLNLIVLPKKTTTAVYRTPNSFIQFNLFWLTMIIIVMAVASMPFKIKTKIINYKNAMIKTKCNIDEILQCMENRTFQKKYAKYSP